MRATCPHRTCLMGLLSVLLAGGPGALAADLGGACCADLEERIAELEATAVRKGNRKVSLEVYGQVNEAVLYWDDGGEDNTYTVTNDNARSRVGFRGKAKITGEWEAGYRLEIGVRGANSKRFDQDQAGGAENAGLDLRDSNWYLRNTSLGTVYVGRGTTATNSITELDLAQTSQFAKFSDVEDTGLGLFLRSAKSGGLSALTWRRLLGDGGDQPGEGERALDLVRFETAEWNGFTASASWGADDVWDVALRYSGTLAGFKLAAGLGYGEVTDIDQTQTVCTAANPDAATDTTCSNLGGSFSAQHEASGLFVSFGAGIKTDDLLAQTARFAGTGADDEQVFWAINAGIEKKFNSFGKTTVFGQYYDYDGGANQRRTIDGVDGGAADALNPFAAGDDSTVWSTGLQMYGGGLAQSFDSAGLLLYVYYRHYDAEITARQLVAGSALGAVADLPLEDLDVVVAGGLIKF